MWTIAQQALSLVGYCETGLRWRRNLLKQISQELLPKKSPKEFFKRAKAKRLLRHIVWDIIKGSQELFVDVVELVDTHDSGSCGEILGGSIPPIDILFYSILPLAFLSSQKLAKKLRFTDQFV